MIPHVERGDRFYGLIAYLAGPGRANEHEYPHVIAGDPFVQAWYVGRGELDEQSVKDIVTNLDQPRKQFGVKIPSGHVWHCSLSIAAEEGELSDEKWSEIAKDFLEGMGFDDQEGTRAPMRWVAIRHGKSKAGNDHIHLAVQLVREDGTKADTWRDFPRAQKVCRELEMKHGLEELKSAGRGRSARGYQRGEREAQARRRAKAQYEKERAGLGPLWRDLPAAAREARINAQKNQELDRVKLARGVRAAAAGARSEAEFVRRIRRQGLLIRPRFAEGSLTQVEGFSIAVRPVGLIGPDEQAPIIWYGGYRLAHDLSLPRLRMESMWPETPAHVAEAEAEWQAAYKGQKIVRPGAEPAAKPTPELFERFRAELRQVEERMSQVPLSDVHAWARLARQASGVYAAWSNVLETVPGPLACASDTLAEQATTKHYVPRPQRREEAVSFTGTAIMLAMAATAKDASVPRALLANQLVMFAIQLAKIVKEAGEAKHADRILQTAREQYASVKDAVTGIRATASSTVLDRPVAQYRTELPGSVADLPPELRLSAYRPELRVEGVPAEPVVVDPSLRMEDLLAASDRRRLAEQAAEPSAEEILKRAFPGTGTQALQQDTPVQSRPTSRPRVPRPERGAER